MEEILFVPGLTDIQSVCKEEPIVAVLNYNIAHGPKTVNQWFESGT